MGVVAMTREEAFNAAYTAEVGRLRIIQNKIAGLSEPIAEEINCLAEQSNIWTYLLPQFEKSQNNERRKYDSQPSLKNWLSYKLARSAYNSSRHVADRARFELDFMQEVFAAYKRLGLEY